MRFVFQYAPDSEAPAELDLLPARREGLVRRRDRHAHDAQPLHAARRQGARRAQVERLHRRGDAALRRRRGRVRQPPLAGVGQRARPRLPGRSATPTATSTTRRCASRTQGYDAAARSPSSSSCRRRSRRASRTAATTAPCATTRRRSTSLFRLVRRQSGEPRSAAARGARPELRRGDGRRGGRARARRATAFAAATIAGRRRCSNHLVFAEPEQRRGARRCSRPPTTSSATRPSPARGATST